MAVQKTRQDPGEVGRGYTPVVERDNAQVGLEINQVVKAWERFARQLTRSSRNVRPLALGVTSAVRGEGRTTGSVALAIALTKEAQVPVALLGIDRQGYGLAEVFDLVGVPDLDGVIRGTWSIEAALSATGIRGLAVLPARGSDNRLPLPPGRFWPYLRRVMPGLLAGLKQEFGYVVCDLPPLFSTSEAIDIANEMDAIVVVTRSGVTPVRKLEQGLSFIDEGRLVGVVHIGGEPRLPKWLTSLLLD